MKPLAIHKVRYLDSGELTCMSESHNKSGDTIGDEQVGHKSIQ